jgi:hypothetical protein
MKTNFTYNNCFDVVDEEKAAVIDDVTCAIETFLDITGESFEGIVTIAVAGFGEKVIQGEHHIRDWQDEYGIVLNFDK